MNGGLGMNFWMALERSRFCIFAILVSTLAAFCLFGCKVEELNHRSAFIAGNGKKIDPDADAEGSEGTQGNLNLLSNSEAINFLKRNCQSCHGIDKNGNHGPNYSSWPMSESELSVDALEVSFFAPIVYQALANKLLDSPPSYPQAMPPGSGKATGEQAKSFMQMLAWFQVNLPLVVAEAEDVYGHSVDDKVSQEVKFICSEPITLRRFLNRFTNSAFDRLPTKDEIAMYSSKELNDPVTQAQRKALSAKLWNDGNWRNEFERIGLLKLARAIGGAPALNPVGHLTKPIVDDLKLEFFRLLLAGYKDTDYSEVFKKNVAYVTSRTAPLYDCSFDSLEPIPGDDHWRECQLELPRSGYFTSVGFLASRPQSFLDETNNYGRVASLYFTLTGEGFRAATNGPAGSGEVNPLPDCLETIDNRAVTGAPRGSAAVPLFGNNCQGCHISRNLAAGSVLFRDFSPDGRIYTPDNIEVISPDALSVATSEEWTYKDLDSNNERRVTKDFLKRLLTVDKKACSVSFNPSEDPKVHTTVNDLATFLMSNKKRLARGFMRHAQRAFLNAEGVNFDLVYQAVNHVDNNKLVSVKDLITLYFESETFACKVK